MIRRLHAGSEEEPRNGVVRCEICKFSTVRNRDLNGDVNIARRLLGCSVASVQQLMRCAGHAGSHEIIAMSRPPAVDRSALRLITARNEPRFELEPRWEEIARG